MALRKLPGLGGSLFVGARRVGRQGDSSQDAQQRVDQGDAQTGIHGEGQVEDGREHAIEEQEISDTGSGLPKTQPSHDGDGQDGPLSQNSHGAELALQFQQ